MIALGVTVYLFGLFGTFISLCRDVREWAPVGFELIIAYFVISLLWPAWGIVYVYRLATRGR